MLVLKKRVGLRDKKNHTHVIAAKETACPARVFLLFLDLLLLLLLRLSAASSGRGSPATAAAAAATAAAAYTNKLLLALLDDACKILRFALFC